MGDTKHIEELFEELDELVWRFRLAGLPLESITLLARSIYHAKPVESDHVYEESSSKDVCRICGNTKGAHFALAEHEAKEDVSLT